MIDSKKITNTHTNPNQGPRIPGQGSIKSVCHYEGCRQAFYRASGEHKKYCSKVCRLLARSSRRKTERRVARIKAKL